MKWIKSHKSESVIIGISIMMLVFILIFVKIFFFSSGKDAYGDRLDGIDDVKISGDKLGKIETELKKNASVTQTESHIEGRVIHFIITVKGEADLGSMKQNTDAILDDFSKKEKEFYDIEVYLISDGESTVYPNIGYKSKTADTFSWIGG